ncbi:FAD-binding oxidoreductase [Limnohabitans sp.]|uniref:FAD-binding oxidoreductase n=1 Tax=Limnohabitans sp. TaxID=1907725 RepID=UPI002FDCA46B
MLKIQTTYGKAFSQSASQTLLDAAAKSGIGLPYNCKTGRCSTCKCKVLSGQSVATVDELGLTSEEKAQGFILSCVRSALTDMLIDVEDLGDQVIPEIKTVPTRISSLEKLAPDILSVKLRLPPNTPFTFLAGQYVDVIGPAGIRRSYSVANAPASDNQLQLHIRAVQSGAMSQYWFDQAKVNDLLRINGPLGSFFARPLNGLHLVFLTTGTGIAPAKAMLEQLATAPLDNQPLSATLYWGGRDPQDLYTDPRQWHPSLRYVPVLSRACDDWTGARGYVQHSLLSEKLDLTNTVVYACGSDTMIQSAKAELTQAGLPTNRFYSDAFVPSGM